MSIVVFWVDPHCNGFGIGSEDNSVVPLTTHDPHCKRFNDSELSEVLSFAEKQRKAGYSHVTISTELADNIGKPGVNAVEDGKTPDGHDYEWSKKQRGDGPRKV